LDRFRTAREDADPSGMWCRRSSKRVLVSSPIPFRVGDVLLVDVPERPAAGARTCRSIIESVEGDTVRVVFASRWSGRAAADLLPGLRTWAGFQHRSGVYTVAATVAARIEEHPLRIVLRIPGRVDRIDDRTDPRRQAAVPVTLYVAGEDGFTAHVTSTDDLGPGGFSCPAPADVRAGDEIGVSLDLPEGRLDALARIVTLRTWDLPDERPRAHVQFVDLTAGSVERVGRFVADDAA
jgi:hypothetical protein